MVKVRCRYLYLHFFCWYLVLQIPKLIFVVANYPLILLYIIGNTNFLFVVINLKAHAVSNANGSRVV